MASATSPVSVSPDRRPSRLDGHALRRAAFAIVRNATGAAPGGCCRCGEEGCQKFAGIEMAWARRLVGLATLLVGGYYSDEGLTEHEKAMELANDQLQRMIEEINQHFGGRVPMFPLEFPAIDWSPQR